MFEKKDEVKRGEESKEVEVKRGADPEVVKAAPVEKEVVDKELSFETTQPVSFVINGEKFEGTKFSFDSKKIAEDRKQMLIRSYGEDIIS